jgi:hypothetical protein
MARVSVNEQVAGVQRFFPQAENRESDISKLSRLKNTYLQSCERETSKNGRMFDFFGAFSDSLSGRFDFRYSCF